MFTVDLEFQEQSSFSKGFGRCFESCAQCTEGEKYEREVQGR
jgi:hypothetical protein